MLALLTVLLSHVRERLTSDHMEKSGFFLRKYDAIQQEMLVRMPWFLTHDAIDKDRLATFVQGGKQTFGFHGVAKSAMAINVQSSMLEQQEQASNVGFRGGNTDSIIDMMIPRKMLV